MGTAAVVCRWSVRSAVLCALVLSYATEAGALTIAGSITNNTVNTTAGLQAGGTAPSEVRSAPVSSVINVSSSGADTTGLMLSFSTQYQAMLSVDNDTTNVSVVVTDYAFGYKITFTVTPTSAAVTYALTIPSSSFVGALTLFDDGKGDASASTSAVTGTLSVNSDAAVPIAGYSLTTTPAGPGQTQNQPFSPSIASSISLGSFTGTNTFDLVFSWTVSATSGRDEAAFRLGLPGTVSGISADDYPGQGVRTAANDGHFAQVQVVVTSVPSPPGVSLPPSLVLLVAGLAGVLGAAWRKHHRV
jgi:hypothetical protein